MEITEMFERQRRYFLSGATRSADFRLRMLRRLREEIVRRETVLMEALREDLGKQAQESYMCEIGLVLDEIRYHERHLRGWMRERRVATPLAQFPAVSFTSPEPYGVVLIAAPWNYPILLSLQPLIGAISGGNCAIMKPSAQTAAVSRALAELIAACFPPQYITVAQCGRETAGALLEQPWDYIFFTGSADVGHTVLAAAAKHLTPVTLELGGKSPVIVDETANIPVAARRIAFGKTLNAGQTCVAPDYLLLHRSRREEFIAAYRRALAEFFPDGDRSAMVHIVNRRHFDRLVGLLAGTQPTIGGGWDEQTLRIEPTLLMDLSPDAAAMQEEIFGPILPVMLYDDLGECIDFIRARAKPLALYLFTKSRTVERRVRDSCSFGGGCVNDTVIHLATHEMPFGGVGASGMGQYHGRRSFETFSHQRSIVRKGTWLDLPMRYLPYSEGKLRLVRKFLK